MHSAPSGQSLSERLVSALYRRLRPPHGGRIFLRPRLLSVLLGSVVLGVLAAAVPMVSTARDTASPIGFDDSSSAGTGSARADRGQRSDVVQMGVDGDPASASADTNAPAASPAGAQEATADSPASATAPPASATTGAVSATVADSTATAGSAGSATRTPTPSRPVTLPQPPTVPAPVPTTTSSPSPSPSPTDPSATSSPSPTTELSPQP